MSESDFLKIFKQRGFFHQCTDEEELNKLLNSKKIPVYIGFDCTASALHVGSLMQIMILRWLQKLGYLPIILLGGGTTKVGDPSGKDESRKILSEDDINNNKEKIKNIFAKYIDLSEGKAMVIDNNQWLSNLNYIDFLRGIGKHFSINRMLTFESVKMRLDREQTLSFLEFNYMILQAYDFVELNKNYGCKLQIGGSDQWGNIINGIELNRRLGNEEIFGLTTPLITTSSGAKMGKTAQGAVWLSEELFSAYDYWQFWRNCDDADVGRFLRFFTELPIEEIEKLEKLKDAEINIAKIVLANEATTLCHGEEKSLAAKETARKTFEQGEIGESLPEVEINKSEFTDGISAFKIFQISGLVESGGAAKRLIKGGGAKVNDEKINDEMFVINENHIIDNIVKLSAGKKKHAVIKVV